jgi:hypothetical protein
MIPSKLLPIKKLVQIPEIPDGILIPVSLEQFQSARLVGLPVGTILCIPYRASTLAVQAKERKLVIYMRFELHAKEHQASIAAFDQALTHANDPSSSGKTSIYTWCVPTKSDPEVWYCNVGTFFTRGSSGAEVVEAFEESLDKIFSDAREILRATVRNVIVVPCPPEPRHEGLGE